jgi:hypothetical protein
VRAGGESAVLTELADRLCAELGSPDDALEGLQLPSEDGARLFGELLDPEDERLIATARRSLTRIAAAVGAGHSDSAPDKTVSLLLDGAEIVMRAELVRGNPLAKAMPDFVFLVVLPFVEQDEALELSRRTAALLERLAASREE